MCAFIGGFPLPQAAAELCQKIPPPDCFQGPFVIVDRLMESFMSMQLAKDFIVPRHINNGQNPRLFETASTHGFNPDLAAMAKGQPPPTRPPPVEHAPPPPVNDPVLSMGRNSRERSHTPQAGNKRRRNSPGDRRRDVDDDDDNDSSLSAASANDIYRQRQQKMMR